MEMERARSQHYGETLKVSAAVGNIKQKNPCTKHYLPCILVA